VPITNPSSTCPHYFQPNPVPGQPSICRGCGAIIAVPNPQSPARAIAAYPGTTSSASGSPTSQGRLVTGNSKGHAFGEV
jgi:hypothetical protein